MVHGLLHDNGAGFVVDQVVNQNGPHLSTPDIAVGEPMRKKWEAL